MIRSVCAICALLLAGCVLPARSAAAYEGKAVESATLTRSAVSTALLTVTEASRGKTTAAFASVTLSNAESDADSAQASFASVQPPSHASDALRSQLGTIQTNVVTELSQLRIEARRGHLRALATSADDLQRLEAQLIAFVQAHR